MVRPLNTGGSDGVVSRGVTDPLDDLRGGGEIGDGSVRGERAFCWGSGARRPWKGRKGGMSVEDLMGNGTVMRPGEWGHPPPTVLTNA